MYVHVHRFSLSRPEFLYKKTLKLSEKTIGNSEERKELCRDRTTKRQRHTVHEDGCPKRNTRDRETDPRANFDCEKSFQRTTKFSPERHVGLNYINRTEGFYLEIKKFSQEQY